MIGFNTILPLPQKATVEEFLMVCRRWQAGSPHRTLPIDDCEIYDGLKYNSDYESLDFVNVPGEKGVHCGVRHIRKDETGEWRTDVLGYKTSKEFQVTIVSLRTTFNIATYTELPKNPHIFGMLIKEWGELTDDSISIENKPKRVTEQNVEEIAALIENKCNNQLPVVYVSKQFDGSIPINVEELSFRLAGLAHVYVENESISMTLRKLTSGKNAYNGTIGIYWPNGERNYFRKGPTDLIPIILNFIKRVLNTRKVANEYRWSFVQNLRHSFLSQKDIDLFADLAFKESEDLKKKISFFEEEVLQLNEEIESLKNENRYLLQLTSGANATQNENDQPILYKGKEFELFTNEQTELILGLIEEKMNHGGTSTRVKNILKSILKENEKTNHKKKFLGDVKRALTSTDGFGKKQQKEMEELNFEISEDGKHYKLKILGDPRYAHPVSKTASDHRAAQNNFSQFKKNFL